ncbi:restriction endonuclease subunit S [Micromonospora sp. U56]|nr:restriction endonuclease subunit S [Micromonospora sp. U56]
MRLSDLARLESGHTPSRNKPEYWDGEIPWVGIRDATANHGRTIHSTKQAISELGLANSSARLLPAGTVCLSRTASVGYVVTMGVPMATSQDFVNWICGPELSPRLLHYILMCEQESVRRFAHGTTHQTVYYPEAKAFHVCIPGRPEQDAIAALLGALDEKIVVNERIATAADELRMIQMEAAAREDPALVPLSSLASFVNGRNFTKDASGSGRMVIRIAEVGSGPGASTVYNDVETSEQHLARPGDVLFSWSGTLKVARWCRPEALINQHIFKVVPNGGVPAWMMFDLIAGELPAFRAIAADKATTMGHIQRKHLDKSVAVPKRELWGSLDRSLGVLWNRALVADREALALADLRDTLLPKLISGELRVKDAERLVSGAV